VSECRGATDDSAIRHAIRKALRRLCHVAVHGVSCLHYGDSVARDKCGAVSRVVAQVGRDTCRLWPHAARRVLSVRGHCVDSFHDAESGARCAVGARRCHTDILGTLLDTTQLPCRDIPRGSREGHGARVARLTAGVRGYARA
jgi:hypothetical protein